MCDELHEQGLISTYPNDRHVYVKREARPLLPGRELNSLFYYPATASRLLGLLSRKPRINQDLSLEHRAFSTFTPFWSWP